MSDRVTYLGGTVPTNYTSYTEWKTGRLMTWSFTCAQIQLSMRCGIASDFCILHSQMISSKLNMHCQVEIAQNTYTVCPHAIIFQMSIIKWYNNLWSRVGRGHFCVPEILIVTQCTWPAAHNMVMTVWESCTSCTCSTSLKAVIIIHYSMCLKSLHCLD